MRPILLAALALVALPLAGCAEEGGEVDTESTTGTSGTRTSTRTGTGGSFTTTMTGGNQTGGNSTGNATGTATGNTTGNATGNATGNSTGNATWTYDNRTGKVSGTAIPVLSPSFSKTESFNVTNGTQTLELNLTSTGSQITLTVSPPGCKEAACANTTKTTSGKASVTFDAPEEGTWAAKLTVSGTAGSVSADYTLRIGRLVVPSNGTTPTP